MVEAPKEFEKKLKKTGKEGFMVEIINEMDAENATSFVSLFSRFNPKAYPSRILRTV